MPFERLKINVPGWQAAEYSKRLSGPILLWLRRGRFPSTKNDTKKRLQKSNDVQALGWATVFGHAARLASHGAASTISMPSLVWG